MTGETRLYLERLWRLTLAEFKLREQSTVVGFLWTLLQPLLLFSVLYGLFTRWQTSPPGFYAASLLIGIVQYGFFNAGSTFGLSSPSRRGELLLNFRVPRELVVFSAVLAVGLSYLLELGVMLGFVVVLGHKPQAAWLALPAIVAVHVALVLGLSLWLAVVAARYPDWERIWSILTMAGFFLTPIFYPLDAVSAGRRRVLLLNPMTHVIELTRGCLLRGEMPAFRESAALALGSALLLYGGWLVFKRYELAMSDWVTG